MADTHSGPYLKPDKAYLNESFLTSPGAKTLRVMCEMAEPEQRFADQGVEHTMLFFGSARARSPAGYDADLAALEERLKAADDASRPGLEDQLARLKKSEWMCEFYTKVYDLAKRLTEWSMARPDGDAKYVVSTGGGPGMMEAANSGAQSVAGARSAGLGITLPFEAGLNPAVTPELGFEFQYFFTRKYWLLNPARALVVCPGGFGTLDELFETLTLIQTGREDDNMPIVLLSERFWKSVINVDALVEFGTISPRDAKRMLITDSVEEAYAYVVAGLEERESRDFASSGATSMVRTPHSKPKPAPLLSPKDLAI